MCTQVLNAVIGKRSVETRDHFKNGASPKSLMSRGNFKIFVLAMLVSGIFTFNTCKKDKDGNVPQNVIDLVHEVEGFIEKPVWAEKEEVVPESDFSWYEQTDDDPRVKSSSGLIKSSTLDCPAFNVKWDCVMKRYSASQNPNDFVMFNPLASVLWPGNLVQGASLETGVPTSIPVTKRQPGNISLAIVTSGSIGATMYRTVDKMQFSYVNQAMNEILSGFSGQGYAQYNFEMDVVKSSEHLEFLLNASFAGWGASVRAGLSTNSSDDKTRILVKLHQSYFTMVYDDPAGLDGVFTPDITVNDLRNYTGIDDNGKPNPICYISSVTYGRMYYLLFESSASENELTAALNASYKGWGVSAGSEMDAKTKETFAKTTARVFQMGGGGEGGITAGTAVDLEAIRDFMEKGINFNAQNTGAPISYTVKYLKDAKIVRMNNAMEYEVPDCVPEVTDNVCPNPPELTTDEPLQITARTAILGGQITYVGEPTYTERGVCYSDTPYPTIYHQKWVMTGTGMGGFSDRVSDLTPGTTYYVRAYAINSEDPAYGNEVEFTTENDEEPSDPPALSGLKIQFGDYKISATTSTNYFREGQYWMGYEIGEEGGSILHKQPTGSNVYDDYGKYDDKLKNNKTVVRTYQIKPNENAINVQADKNKRLYIKFKVKTDAGRYYWGAPFGTIAWFDGDVSVSGEKTVYYEYNSATDSWIAGNGEQSSASYTTAAGSFTFTHTFNYGVSKQ